jgi:hypothetical protein
VTLDEESTADSEEFMSGIRAGMVEEAVLLLRLVPVAHLPGQPRSPVRLRGTLRPVGGGKERVRTLLGRTEEEPKSLG